MSPLASLLLAWLAGFAAWPLVEYVVHGVLSHRLSTPISQMHASHHVDPRRVFTPTGAWVTTALILLALLSCALGLPLAAALMSGLVTGFARYEHIHYNIHFRTPTNDRERRRRQHHLAHHYRNPGAYFGVTNQFTDRLFGSLPENWRHDYTTIQGRKPP